MALNNSMRTLDFVSGVGATFVEDFFGMDNAQVAGPHVPGRARRGPAGSRCSARPAFRPRRRLP